MRADDLANITIMVRDMDQGGRRVTAQLADGTDIAHAFYQPQGNQLRPTMVWISDRWKNSGILDHLQSAASGSDQLQEISLGKLAKAAAVGAGVLGSAYLSQPAPPANTTQALPTVSQPAADRSTARNEDPMAQAAAAATAAAPMAKISPIDTEHKVSQFLDSMVPLVRAENDRIGQERQTAIRLVSKIQRGKALDTAEERYLQSLLDRYGTADPMELLKKVDMIPPSMAVAQAAVESGWGQDALAQKANVLFGQKTWGKDQGVPGPAGERYVAFANPADSVRAYMQNLNTHPAYERFRDVRADLRAHGKPITAQTLLPTLTKYSRLGKDYVSKVAKVIKGRNLHKLDR